MLFYFFLVLNELEIQVPRGTIHSTALQRERLVHFGVFLISWILIQIPDFKSISHGPE
jgi:hypothetical protein